MSGLDPTQSVLEAAMRGATLRQSLLTANLANANTPGYQAQDVNFQSQLQSAINSGQSSSLDTMSFRPSSTTGAVNSDQQSAALAENGLLYDTLAQILTAHNTTLEYAFGTK